MALPASVFSCPGVTLRPRLGWPCGVSPGSEVCFLGSRKDAEEQQKQSNNYRHQKKERFALVAAKLLTSRRWFLLSPRSLERRAEHLAPVSFARLLLLRLLGRYF